MLCFKCNLAHWICINNERLNSFQTLALEHLNKARARVTNCYAGKKNATTQLTNYKSFVKITGAWFEWYWRDERRKGENTKTNSEIVRNVRTRVDCICYPQPLEHPTLAHTHTHVYIYIHIYIYVLSQKCATRTHIREIVSWLRHKKLNSCANIRITL